MPGLTPPYALDTVPPPFPAIADAAGRAPLGGDRDLILGIFTAARLAGALLPPVELDASAARVRADRTKGWLSGLTMPQPARMSLMRVAEATAAGAGTASGRAAEALAELARTVTGHLDSAAEHELDGLIAHLRLYYQQTQTP